MKEYKREKQDLERSVKSLEEQSKDYEAKLLVVDAWWNQVRGISRCLQPC